VERVPVTPEGRTPLRLALAGLAWGLAEATLFFIVPDVLISYAGLRSARRAVVVSLWAVCGAVAGGAVMWWFGAHRPDVTFEIIGRLPGISAGMLRSVVEQTRALGIGAVLVGPARGTPYKIYASEWGRTGGALLPFLLASLPARLPRFLIVGLASRGAVRLFSRRADPDYRVATVVLACSWIAFYAWYWWWSATRGFS
jgi:membrane protein YqaA with SNARE-associated domain